MADGYRGCYVRRVKFEPRIFVLAAAILTIASGASLASEQASGAEPATLPATATAIDGLKKWLETPRDQRPPISKVAFASAPLSRTEAEQAFRLLWEDHAANIRATRADEMKAKTIELGGQRMRFEMLSFGNPKQIPAAGRSLFISMHGGGGAPPAVNESQWRNQVRLGQAYAPAEGIYLAPRAPTDTWNLWHQSHIDRFFDRLIENLVVLAKVNPDRVYILGYSAGGDGVYQLAPRMADRWAGAAMMGGHPNETSPLGLRNLPFALQVGEKDSAYKRNQVAAEWGKKLDELRRADPGGYEHFTELHAGKGHWMDLADRKAIPWMEKFTRNPYPDRVVWKQDDVTHERFYWLAVPPGSAKRGQEIVAERSGSVVTLKAEGVTNVIVRFNDRMLDLDQPVTIRAGNQVLFNGKLNRTIASLAQSLEGRGDPRLVFSAGAQVGLP